LARLEEKVKRDILTMPERETESALYFVMQYEKILWLQSWRLEVAPGVLEFKDKSP